MAGESVPEQLSNLRYVTLILRLVVDCSGELMYGDVGSQAAYESSLRWVHFRGASGLFGAVQASLTDEQHNSDERTP
jgi:hypothetical protein